MNNIFEIKSVNDIETILKSSSGKFVILSITLNNTPLNTKINIRKWLKKYSVEYKNVVFLYMSVTSEDLGKLSIFKEDVSKYPLLYYIYNINNICISVDNVDTEGINEAYNKMKHYLDDTKIEVDDNNTNENKLLEQKKLLEQQNRDKLIYLENHAEDYKINFLTDIKNRKLVEEEQ